MKWTKLICTLLVLTCMACQKEESSPTLAQASGESPVDDSGSTGVGNGGGVIIRNGDVLTFQEAGMSFEVPVEPAGINLPEIDLAKGFVERMALPKSEKGQLLRALLPLGERRYFKLNENDLSPIKKAELLAAYQRVAGQLSPGESLQIVALTIGKETFFLPDYFKLKDTISKETIVLHEAMWVYNPRLSLRDVLRTEVAIEKFLRSPDAKMNLIYERNLFKQLGITLGAEDLAVTGALLKDLEKGPLTLKLPALDPKDSKSVVIDSSQKLRLDFLVGEEEGIVYLKRFGFISKDIVRHYWTALGLLNPQSHFAQSLIDVIADFEVYLGSDRGFDKFGGFDDMGNGSVCGSQDMMVNFRERQIRKFELIEYNCPLSERPGIVINPYTTERYAEPFVDLSLNYFDTSRGSDCPDLRALVSFSKGKTAKRHYFGPWPKEVTICGK